MIYVDRKNFKISFSERVIGHYGDNCVESIVFEIGENISDCEYILYIAFSDGSINSILLEKGENNTATWNIKAEHIFRAGLAFIQIKAVGKNGEVWHSPKTAVELLHSIDQDEPKGEYIPSVFEKLDSKINELLEYTPDKNEYITKPEAIELIAESIDDLLLPLSKRLDGE